MRIYVDGCSLTYGEGLPRADSIGARLGAELDLSRPGKSNMAMAIDLIDCLDTYDLYVLGFTYPSRYTFYHQDTAIDVTPAKEHIGQVDVYLEQNFPVFSRMLWTMTNDNRMEDLSKFIVEGAMSLLKQHGKQYVVYGWYPYECEDSNFFTPEIPETAEYRLAKDNFHLNSAGMELLERQIRLRYE